MSIRTRVAVVQFFTGRVIDSSFSVVVTFKCLRRPKYEQSEVWLLQTAAGERDKKKKRWNTQTDKRSSF